MSKDLFLVTFLCFAMFLLFKAEIAPIIDGEARQPADPSPVSLEAMVASVRPR